MKRSIGPSVLLPLLALLAFLPRVCDAANPTVTPLYSFTGGSDGKYVSSGLIQGNDGNFYGATVAGGANNGGTVFKLTLGGTPTTLYSFSGNEAYSKGGLLQGSDGNFYGTIVGDIYGDTDVDNFGTIFRLTPGGTFTTVHSFTADGDDGLFPVCDLIQGSDGNFYGTTERGGTNDGGTIFRFTPDLYLTTLHRFDGSDGSKPRTGVVQGSDGNFYGTTTYGNFHGTFDGSVFRITLDGVLTTLRTFGGTSGGDLEGALVQGSDGNFYGTTIADGANNEGTVFKITPGGTLTTLHSFGSDGRFPEGALLRASDGNFYGTTLYGGDADDGTIFQITPGGTLTTLHSFSGSDGQNPDTGLIQGSDGNLYGTSRLGANGYGTVYRLNIALPPVVQFHLAINSVNEAAGTASVRVDRIGDFNAGSPVVVVYTTTDGTAVAGTDYTKVSSTLTWNTGDLNPKFITVPITNRGFTDGSLRTLSLSLVGVSDPHGATSLGYPSTATLTINGSIPGAPLITSVKSATGKQGNAFSYQIAATGTPTSYSATGLPKGLSVNTATGLISGTPTQAGASSVALKATNAKGSGTAALHLNISLGNGVLAFGATSYSVDEAAGSITVQVARTLGSKGPVSVTCGTSSGTAKSGTDYTGKSGTLTWLDGDTTPKAFTVAISDLGITDGSARAFTLKLSAPTGGATLGSPANATVTIHENDPVQGELEFAASSYSVNETAGTVTVQVKRTAGSTGAVSVVCGTSSGTAKSGTDYTGKSSTLNWAAGDTAAKAFTVMIKDLGITDGSTRYFSVKLSAPTGGATLGSPSAATVTIHESNP